MTSTTSNQTMNLHLKAEANDYLVNARSIDNLHKVFHLRGYPRPPDRCHNAKSTSFNTLVTMVNFAQCFMLQLLGNDNAGSIKE